MAKTKKYVVVTTDKNRKGVFFGILFKEDKEKKEVILKEAQMAVYWGIPTKGVLGLAAAGPQSECRITQACPEIWLDGVTCIMTASQEAIKKWKEQPWG